MKLITKNCFFVVKKKFCIKKRFDAFLSKMVGGKRDWTASQRNLAVDLVNEGKTYRQVQQEIGIPHNTVSDILKKYNLI